MVKRPLITSQSRIAFTQASSFFFAVPWGGIPILDTVTLAPLILNYSHSRSLTLNVLSTTYYSPSPTPTHTHNQPITLTRSLTLIVVLGIQELAAGQYVGKAERYSM